MSHLTIKLSDRADALIAQLQKEIFNRRRKKVSPAGVVETLVESGAKSQSDKRFATSWKNLIADIEKAAKLADAHGAKPANLSDEEWAMVLNHRNRPPRSKAAASPRQPAAKRAAGKQAVAKPAAVKKVAAKKTAVKKPAAKKPAAKKTAAKTAAASKPVARKTVARKSVARKPVAPKAAARNPVRKKAVAAPTLRSAASGNGASAATALAGVS